MHIKFINEDIEKYKKKKKIKKSKYKPYDFEVLNKINFSIEIF